MSVKILSFSLVGTSPLLLHNAQLASPFNHYAKQLAQLNLDKKKKGADKAAILERMADVEWLGGMYVDATKAPALPSFHLRAAVREAARMSKRGREVERAVFVTGKTSVPLVYDGPKQLDELMSIPAFRDVRVVTVGVAKIARTRPIFLEWALRNAEIGYHADFMAQDDLIAYLERAGLLCGVGDGRAMGFGRFAIESCRVVDA